MESNVKAAMEITIHEKKIVHFTFHGGKKARWITSDKNNLNFTTLIHYVWTFEFITLTMVKLHSLASLN